MVSLRPSTQSRDIRAFLKEVLFIFVGSLITSRGSFGGRAGNGRIRLTVLAKRQLVLQRIIIYTFGMDKQMRVSPHDQVTEWFSKSFILSHLGGGVKYCFDACQKERFRNCFVQMTLTSGWLGFHSLTDGCLRGSVTFSNRSTTRDRII